jgi:uncharacterized protein (DUF779 family)
MAQNVTATAEALELIQRLRAAHGPLVFHQSGGCCDGSAPMCLEQADLPAGPNDVELGTVGGVPFYVDRDQYERWGRPQFVLDVAPGAGQGFALDSLESLHFVTRASCPQSHARASGPLRQHGDSAFRARAQPKS